MDREGWLEYLDTDLPARSAETSKLWTYGFSLLVAGASLAVFVARAFDAGVGSELRAVAVLLAVAASAGIYFLWGYGLMERLIRAHPTLRRLPGPQAPASEVVLPWLYRFLNPRAHAMLVGAIIMMLAPVIRAPQMGVPVGALLMPEVMIVAGLLVVTAVWTAASEGRPVRQKDRSAVRFFQMGPAALAAMGTVAAVIVGVAEFWGRAEAGLAMIGVALIPLLLLSGFQILRWVAHDQSAAILEQVRLEARMDHWPAGRIARAYFEVENARAVGPVLACTELEAYTPKQQAA